MTALQRQATISPDHLSWLTPLLDNQPPHLSLEHTTIETITAVGACYCPINGLSSNDKQWVFCALELCKKQGWHISKAIKITPYNLYDGKDFLSPIETHKQADMIIICNIADHQRISNYSLARNAERLANIFLFSKKPSLSTDDKASFDLILSPHQFCINGWESAILKGSPKVIASVSNLSYQAEVAVEDFNLTTFSEPSFCYTPHPTFPSHLCSVALRVNNCRGKKEVLNNQPKGA